MPKSVLSRGRSFVARFAALAMVASIMVIGAVPASAAIDTSTPCPASTPSAGFTDIGAFDATTQRAINCLVNHGISNGTSATTYSPNGEVVRWQMALFLTRQASVHGITLPDGSDQGFTDIGGLPVSYQVAINQLAQLDITKGTSATTFSPNDPVTREQMALFLARLAGADSKIPAADDSDQGYTDIGSLTAESQSAINAITDLGIAEGTGAGTFSPLANTLRWHMALFLTRTLAAAGIPAPSNNNPVFTAAPELVNVEELPNGVVRYNFDQPIPGINADPADFFLYTTGAVASNPSEVSITGQTVLARFTTAQVSSAIRAGVRTGAVETGTGIPSIAGGFPLSVSANQPNNLTPNLLSVGNYRFASVQVGGDTYVLVDFVFDGDAEDDIGAAVGDETNYALYGVNGQEFLDIGVDPVVDYDSDSDTTTVTVAFGTNINDVPQSQLRRGVYDDGNYPLLSANFGATGGTTVDPDLVSVTRQSATVFVFQFDEAVSGLVADLDATAFWVVQDDGTIDGGDAIERINDAQANKVRVQFNGLTNADIVVHGWVEDGGVVASDNTNSDNAGVNRPAAQPLTIPTLADPTPGNTSAAELVSAQRLRDVVTGRYSIQLTFDKAVDLDGAGVHDVTLYDAAGVAFVATLDTATSNATDTVWVISSTDATLSDDVIEATVTVSVQTTVPTAHGVAKAATEATEAQASATTLVNQ